MSEKVCDQANVKMSEEKRKFYNSFIRLRLGNELLEKAKKYFLEDLEKYRIAFYNNQKLEYLNVLLKRIQVYKEALIIKESLQKKLNDICMEHEADNIVEADINKTK